MTSQRRQVWARLVLALFCAVALSAPAVTSTADQRVLGHTAAVVGHTTTHVAESLARAAVSGSSAFTVDKHRTGLGAGLLPASALLVALLSGAVLRRRRGVLPYAVAAASPARAPPADVVR